MVLVISGILCLAPFFNINFTRLILTNWLVVSILAIDRTLNYGAFNKDIGSLFYLMWYIVFSTNHVVLDVSTMLVFFWFGEDYFVEYAQLRVFDSEKA